MDKFLNSKEDAKSFLLEKIKDDKKVNLVEEDLRQLESLKKEMIHIGYEFDEVDSSDGIVYFKPFGSNPDLFSMHADNMKALLRVGVKNIYVDLDGFSVGVKL